MFKPVVVATAALAIVGSSIVYAQQRFGAPDGQDDPGRRSEHRHWLSAEDMAAFADARIAALKAGLQLTPDQAKNWPAFEQALREMAQLRIERVQARQAAAQQGQTPVVPATPFDRLAKKADSLSKVGSALKHIADTGAPLYQSLTDAQKRRFHILARMLRPHHHHMYARNDGSGRDWRHGQGFGPDGQGRGWQGFGPRRFGMEGNAPDEPAQNLTESEDQGSEL